MGQQRSLDREVQEAAPMEGNEKRLVGDDNPLLWILSLAAKPSDSLSMILLQRDSVTFSTARHRFDINRISAAGCISRQPIQGGLTQLRYPESCNLVWLLQTTFESRCGGVTHLE